MLAHTLFLRYIKKQCKITHIILLSPCFKYQYFLERCIQKVNILHLKMINTKAYYNKKNNANIFTLMVIILRLFANYLLQ